MEYPKIQSIYKRDERTHKFIEGRWSLPEFEYLKNNRWIWTEKVDGTNIRVFWDNIRQEIRFGGKTDNAQMPIVLLDKLTTIFTKDKFISLYLDVPMILFGEGYGAKIQKGGGNYIKDGIDFVLFDILIDNIWLERFNMEDIADKLSIKIVPIIETGTLLQAVEKIKTQTLYSTWGNFLMEGLVLKPCVELKNRRGHRIITKIKHKDF